MSDFVNMRLTRQGQQILAKGLIGKEIKFTKAALGDGDFDSDTEVVMDLTDLKSKQLDIPIVDKEIKGDGMALIKCNVNNINLTKGFRAKEHGIYAEDPDSGDEVLYAYHYVGDEYSFIPAGFGHCKINVVFGYFIEIQDADNVTFVIDYNFAYVSKQEYSPLESRFKMLWSNYINASDDDIDKILAGTYKPTGSTGDGELNGVPTDSDIDAILNGSYTSHQIVVEDEYCVDVPTDSDIDTILGDV